MADNTIADDYPAYEQIHLYEELQWNAWPAFQTLCADGWLLRYGRGFTKRANSVYPLYPAALGFEEKIAACEAFYRDKGQAVCFKLTEASQPAGLDAELARRGYARIDEVSIQTRPLAGLPAAQHGILRTSPEMTAEWLEVFCSLAPERAKDKETIRELFRLPLPPCQYGLLEVEGQIVACGLAVRQGEHVGLFDIVTDPAYRRLGYGEALLLHMLNLAVEEGARVAYLQVLAANAAAMSLYAKLGFSEKYKQWYRIKPSAAADHTLSC